MPPRTIDNLGLDVSTRYAEDQKHLDSKFIKESRGIQSQTQIDVTIPSFSSEFDQLFGTAERNKPWAAFYAPNKYNEQKKRLFTFQTIPSLGSQDKNENLAQKILTKLQEAHALRSSEKEKKQGQDKEDQGKPSKQKKWEEEKEYQEQKKEEKILINLLNRIILLDKITESINAKRAQYQRG